MTTEFPETSAADPTSPGTGIAAIGTYLPRFQLSLTDVASVLGSASGTGLRRIGGYDEDSITIAVAALRPIFASRAPTDIAGLLFATSDPAYLGRTCASIVHAATNLPESATAGDIGGGTRASIIALRYSLAAARAGTDIAVVAADLVSARPGSPEEAEGGDAGVAFIVTAHDPAVEHLSSASRTFEVMNRWKLPTDRYVQRWEERFVEAVYAPQLGPVVAEALLAAGIDAADITSTAVSGGPARLLTAVGRSLPGELVADHRKSSWGNSGAALGPLLLARAAARAEPGDLVLCVHIGDGIDVDIWRVHRRPHGSEAVLEDGPPPRTVPYGRYLSWRSGIDVEPPRRPVPVRPAAPPSWRSRRWKFGAIAARCEACGHVNAPPGQLCAVCSSAGPFSDVRLAHTPGVAAEVTTDYLAYSPSPPIIAGNVLFEGGGRIQIELTDCTPEDVGAQSAVELVFRRLYSAEGVHDYFWKARPVS